MNEKKIDESLLKSKGFLPQRQENMFSMRLKVVSGNLDAEKLRAIADAAEKYGSGYIHITSRQQIEVLLLNLKMRKQQAMNLKCRAFQEALPEKG